MFTAKSWHFDTHHCWQECYSYDILTTWCEENCFLIKNCHYMIILYYVGILFQCINIGLYALKWYHHMILHLTANSTGGKLCPFVIPCPTGSVASLICWLQWQGSFCLCAQPMSLSLAGRMHRMIPEWEPSALDTPKIKHFINWWNIDQVECHGKVIDWNKVILVQSFVFL